jgi:serine/threonine-protein kinase
LATLHDSGLSGDVSESWLIVGTPAYMSPEQSLGKTVDVRTDVYSAGVILFQLLTGEKPYDAEDAFETLKEHREKPIPRLREVCPDVEFPPGLQQLIDRSMAKEPSRRYSSAGKFADALEEVAGGNTGRTPKPMALAPTVQSPIVTVETTRPARRRGSFASMLLAFLLVAGAAGAGAWYLQDISTANTNASEPEPKPSPEPAAGDTPAMPADVRTAPDATVMAAAPPDAAVPDAHPADDGDTDAGDVGGDDEEYVLNLPPDELDEPVAAVEDETAEDDSPAVEPPEPPVPMEIKTIEGAKKLIAAGERERAIAALRKLEREHPKSAYIPYLLGHLYFEKKWWSMGIQEYKVAIRNNRDYRKRSILNKNVIRALGSEKTKSKAISLYLNSIGRSGLKYLRRAAKSDKNKKVRSRANWLIKRLSKKRR